MFSKAEVNPLKYSLMSAFVLAFANMGDSFLYVYLPSNYQTIGVSTFWVGVILSVNRFTRLFLNGWVAYRLNTNGIKLVTITTSAIAIITTISYGFINSVFLWLVARILWGITFSTLRLGNTIYAAQCEKKGVSFGLARSIVEIGSISAILLGALLLSYFERSFTFVLLGIISSVGFFIALRLPNVSLRPIKKEDLVLSFPSSFNILVLLNAFVIEGMLVVLLSNLVLSDLNLTPKMALITTGFCLGYRRACLVLFSPIAGWLADKWGFEKLFNYTSLLLVVGVVLIGSGAVIFGLIIAFTFATMNASVAPVGAITKTGFLLKDISDNATWRDVGSACGTLVGALLLDFHYIHTVFIAAAFPLILILTLHFYNTKKGSIQDGIN